MGFIWQPHRVFHDSRSPAQSPLRPPSHIHTPAPHTITTPLSSPLLPVSQTRTDAHRLSDFWIFTYFSPVFFAFAGSGTSFRDFSRLLAFIIVFEQIGYFLLSLGSYFGFIWRSISGPIRTLRLPPPSPAFLLPSSSSPPRSVCLLTTKRIAPRSPPARLPRPLAFSGIAECCGGPQSAVMEKLKEEKEEEAAQQPDAAPAEPQVTHPPNLLRFWPRTRFKLLFKSGLCPHSLIAQRVWNEQKGAVGAVHLKDKRPPAQIVPVNCLTQLMHDMALSFDLVRSRCFFLRSLPDLALLNASCTALQ